MISLVFCTQKSQALDCLALRISEGLVHSNFILLFMIHAKYYMNFLTININICFYYVFTFIQF